MRSLRMLSLFFSSSAVSYSMALCLSHDGIATLCLLPGLSGTSCSYTPNLLSLFSMLAVTFWPLPSNRTPLLSKISLAAKYSLPFFIKYSATAIAPFISKYQIWYRASCICSTKVTSVFFLQMWLSARASQSNYDHWYFFCYNNQVSRTQIFSLLYQPCI